MSHLFCTVYFIHTFSPFFLFIKQHSTYRAQNISLLWHHYVCDKTLNFQSTPGFYLPYPESPPCKPCITLSQHFHFLCLSHTHVFNLERECCPYMHSKLFIRISFVLSLWFYILFHNNALLDSIPFSMETGMKVCADDDL